MRNKAKTTVAIVGGLAFYWLLLRGNYIEQVLEKGSGSIAFLGSPYLVVFVVLSVAVFFILLIMRTRYEHLLSRHYVPMQLLVCLCLIVDFICTVIIDCVPKPGIWFGTVASASAAIGLSVLLYFWTVLLAKQEAHKVLSTVFCSLLLSFIIEIILSLIPDTFDVAGRVFCGLLSLGFYWVCPSNERRIVASPAWSPLTHVSVPECNPTKQTPDAMTSCANEENAGVSNLRFDAWYPAGVGQIIRAFDGDVRTWKRIVMMMAFLLIVATLIRGLVVELYVDPDAANPRALFYLANIVIITTALIVCRRIQEPLKQLISLWGSAAALLLISYIAILVTPVSTLYFITLFSLALRVSLNVLFFASLVLLARHGAISMMAAFLSFFGMQIFTLAYSFGFSPLFLAIHPSFFNASVGIASVALVLWSIHCIRHMIKLVVNEKTTQVPQPLPSQRYGMNPDDMLSAPAESFSEDSMYESLSKRYRLAPREEEACRLLMSGYSHKAIAQEMNVKTTTASGYIKGLYFKTGCHKKDDLVRLVYDEREALLKEQRERKR